MCLFVNYSVGSVGYSGFVELKGFEYACLLFILLGLLGLLN